MIPIHTISDLPKSDLRAFDDVLGITEDAFVVAGNSLEASIADIRALQTAFSELETIIGPEADASLKRHISEIAGQVQGMQTGFDQIAGATTDMRGIVASVRREVRCLSTIVRLITNISINARIQGNSLSQPKPQIRSFVDRLGQFSAEAETILSDVNGAMAAALEAVNDIELAQIAISAELRQRAFPAIADFTAAASVINAEQPALRESSAVIAEQLKLTSSDVTQLVTSLQIGDTLRQRLEHAQAALADARRNPNEMALAYRIASIQAEGAMLDSLPHIDEALLSLESVGMHGQDIAIAANSSTFAKGATQRSDAGKRPLIALRSSLEASRAHFTAMQIGTQKVRAQMDIIVSHDATLQSIADQVRIAGINAVIACAKVGEDGRALRELAQWLRLVTDDFSDTMQRLQVPLGASGELLESIGVNMIASLETHLSAFLKETSDLGLLIERANDALAVVATRFDIVASDLGDRIQTSTSALLTVRSKLTDIRPTIDKMLVFASLYPEPDVSSNEAELYLSVIRGKYTTATERALHDQLIASLSGGTDFELEPAVSFEVGQNTLAPDADDLDDVFF